MLGGVGSLLLGGGGCDGGVGSLLGMCGYLECSGTLLCPEGRGITSGEAICSDVVRGVVWVK